jgi:NADH:ubiquinone reductase (H+-translocating)
MSDKMPTDRGEFRDKVVGPDPVPAEAAEEAAVPPRPRIVILGAGFGGLAAAKGLAGTPAEVTIIDRHNYHLFQPLLYQVAAAALSPAEIAMPIRAILRRQANAKVLLDAVVGIDLARRCVLTRDNATTRFDFLVIATGSVYSYFGHGEWARVAPGLKSLDDAVGIRGRILLAFEKAETCSDERERERLLTFIIVGGGPTGVELAGAIAELARSTMIRDFRDIDPGRARIVLLEAGARLLAGFAPGLAEYTRRTLERMGVDVRLGAPVDRVEENGVVVQGNSVPAATVLWCAGVQATPVGEWLGVPTARNGTVEVAQDLSLPGYPEIFVVGDAAAVKGPGGRPLPGVAPVAKQQGGYVAQVIRARLCREAAPGPFIYRDKGSLATIGRSAAVADFGRIRLKGRVAWLIWSLAHIYYLIGFRNRVAVFLNWAWAWLTYGRSARLITYGAAMPDTPRLAEADHRAMGERQGRREPHALP